MYSGTTDGSMVRLLHEPQEDTVGMSLRTATQTVGMSLRTVDKTPETEQPGDSAGMSLRTAAQTVGMSLRTVDKTPETEQPGDSAGMSLRTATQTVGMSLRTVDKTPETEQPGDSAGMSLRTATQNRRHVVAGLPTRRLRTNGPGTSMLVCRCGLPNKESVDMSLRTVDTPSENQQPGDQHSGMSLRTARQREEVVCLQEVERVEALWTKPTSRNGGEIFQVTLEARTI